MVLDMIPTMFLPRFAGFRIKELNIYIGQVKISFGQPLYTFYLYNRLMLQKFNEKLSFYHLVTVLAKLSNVILWVRIA